MARTEIARLHAERERYEETMKKAFMRGVCALNLEAMTMFREGEEGGRRQPPAAAVNNNGTSSYLNIFELFEPSSGLFKARPGLTRVLVSCFF